MKRKENLEGKTFNYLLVKQYIGNSRYICECLNCGNETIAPSTKLKSGRKKSCGCMKSKLLHDAFTVHGDSYSRLYQEFYRMHIRCYGNCDATTKRIYQDRNIGICSAWLHNYPEFKNWALNNGYNDGLTIDRIDNDLGYSPENCRWITQLEQASNKRNNVRITINNITHTMSEWCRINGVSYTAACKRIEQYGWDPVKAVTEPTRTYNKKQIASKIIGT